MNNNRVELRELRESLRSTQRLLERSGGIGGKPTHRVWAFLRQPYINLAWWFRFSLVRSVALELCNSVHRIAGVITHRTNEGILVGRHRGTPPVGLLTVRSYSLACSLSMQELRTRYPWFDTIDMLPAMQAFQWGSEWSSCNSNSGSGEP
jgi:hypothetical protein